jgi:hypothetical protein
MENRRLAFVVAAATLDAFLARAIEELRNSAGDTAETNLRGDVSGESFDEDIFEK